MFIEDTEQVVTRISNIASMLCARYSYILIFRDKNNETLLILENYYSCDNNVRF